MILVFLNNVCLFARLGLIREPVFVNFVMGIPGEVTEANVKNLIHLVGNLPQKALWHVSAIGGQNHFPIIASAIAMGGHVRTGMEDNIYISKGVLAKSNAELVEKVVRIARELGRDVATPEEARKMLGLEPFNIKKGGGTNERKDSGN